MTAAYSDYVAAESQWLDTIPAHWRMGRLDQVARAWPSNVDKHSVVDEPPVRLCNYLDVYKNASIVEGMNFMAATASPEQIERFRIAVGDTLLTKDSETADDIGVPAYVEYEAADLICGYHLSIVRPIPGAIDPKFLYWALGAGPTAGQWAVLASGVTRVGIRAGDLAKAALALPPLDEQREIAGYLDRETARIDTLIEEQQRLLVLLQERREAEADSLLGSPSQARHTTVKRVLRALSRPAVSGLGVVTAYRDGVVTLRSNRREDGYTFSDTENGYQEIRPGDLVFHALDGFAGAVGVSDSHGNATPVYHVCEAIASDHLPYVALLLRYLGRSGFLATQAPNVRERSVDFRNWSMFGRLPLALPPVVEQRRVAAHLDAHAAKVDTLIAETKWFIELARERRAALITAAVTGRIDVREVA